MKRGIVFTIHSVAGLVFGLFILIMSLSGAVLVFHEESDRLQYPADVARANGGIVPVDSCYNNLKKNFPGAQISSCLITKSNQRSFVFT
ncbi:MAG: PepSY domain-containing protein, partial [Chitinophagales bacterium]